MRVNWTFEHGAAQLRAERGHGGFEVHYAGQRSDPPPLTTPPRDWTLRMERLVVGGEARDAMSLAREVGRAGHSEALLVETMRLSAAFVLHPDMGVLGGFLASGRSHEAVDVAVRVLGELARCTRFEPAPPSRRKLGAKYRLLSEEHRTIVDGAALTPEKIAEMVVADEGVPGEEDRKVGENLAESAAILMGMLTLRERVGPTEREVLERRTRAWDMYFRKLGVDQLRRAWKEDCGVGVPAAVQPPSASPPPQGLRLEVLRFNPTGEASAKDEVDRLRLLSEVALPRVFDNSAEGAFGVTVDHGGNRKLQFDDWSCGRYAPLLVKVALDYHRGDLLAARDAVLGMSADEIEDRIAAFGDVGKWWEADKISAAVKRLLPGDAFCGDRPTKPRVKPGGTIEASERGAVGRSPTKFFLHNKYADLRFVDLFVCPSSQGRIEDGVSVDDSPATTPASSNTAPVAAILNAEAEFNPTTRSRLRGYISIFTRSRLRGYMAIAYVCIIIIMGATLGCDAAQNKVGNTWTHDDTDQGFAEPNMLMSHAVTHRYLATTTVTTFAELRAAAAAKNQAVVSIAGDLDAWTATAGMDTRNSIVHIKANQRVLIRGIRKSHALLDASANQSSLRRHFEVDESGILEIKNLKLHRGYSSSGGAVYSSGSFTATNCFFSDNDATSGGAVYSSGSFTATNCFFSGNDALGLHIFDILAGNYSGGGAVLSSGSFTAINCSFSSNVVGYIDGSALGQHSTGYGGAVYSSGLFTATNCLFSDNKSVLSVGGAVHSSGSFTATHCILSNNDAYASGGAVFSEDLFSATNCFFFGNNAPLGGAVMANRGLLDAINCIFAANEGSLGDDIYDHTAIVKLTNCTMKKVYLWHHATVIFGGSVPDNVTWTLVGGTRVLAGCPAGKAGRHIVVDGPLNSNVTFPDGQNCDRGFGQFKNCCQSCGRGTYASGADIVCESCPAGKHSEFTLKSKQCINCEAGRSSLGGTTKCAVCNVGKVSRPAAPNCILCDGGSYANVNHTDCVVCGIGYACQDGVKRICMAGSIAGSGGYFCSLCLPGSHAPTAGLATCTPCRAGEYQDEAGASNCKSCLEGVSEKGGLGCNPCPQGHIVDSAKNTCTKCAAGRFSQGGTATICTPCASGSVAADGGSAFCTSCLPGSYAPTAGLATCTPCRAGEYQNVTGQTACDACASGSSERGSSFCTNCAAGTEYSALTKLCERCLQGSVSAPGERCMLCAAGSFATTAQIKCSPCPAGTWSAVVGASSAATCVPCAAGTFNSATGTNALSMCNKCPPGKHSNSPGANTSTACRQCLEGHYAPESGQTSCEACTTGSSNTGSSFCSDCAAGKVLDRSSVPPVCSECNGGAISISGATHCETCGPGSYANPEHTKCLVCPAGTWSNVTGATSDVACAPCAPGRFSSATGVDAKDKCNTCPPGTSSSILGADSSSMCLDCTPSTFAGESGKTACEACKSGTSEAGSSFCTDCIAGKELHLSTCIKCAAGKSSVAGGRCEICESGRHAPHAGAEVCERCPDFMTSSENRAWECVADKGFVVGTALGTPLLVGNQTIHACPKEGTACNAVIGARVETLVLEAGFWRPTHASLDLRPCPLGSGCIGGVSEGTEGEGVCSNVTTGPYCAVCAKDHKRQGGVCVSCDDFKGIPAAPLLALLGVLALVTAVVFLAYKYKPSMFESMQGVALTGMADTSDGSGHGRVVEKFKIAYGFAQAVSSSIEEFDLPFPPAFSAFAAVLSVANLDIFGSLSMGCVIDVDFYGELTTTCIAPAVLAAFSFRYAYHRTSSKSEKRTAMQIFRQFFLVLLFCVYAGVTRKIFTTFKCERFVTAGLDETECGVKDYAWHNGTCYRSYLRADLGLSCDASEYTGWKLFAVIMAFVYPFGVPLLFALLLHRHKDDSSLAFIRAAYEDKFYWWEIVELGRKLLLTLVLVFFYEGSASQILLTLLVAFGFTLVLRTYKPYKSNDDDFLAVFAQALLVLTSLASLCLKVDVTEEDSWSKGWFDFFLTTLVASVLVLATLEALVAAGLFQRPHVDPCLDKIDSALARMINDAVDPELRSRAQLAIAALHGENERGRVSSEAPGHTARDGSRKSLNAKFDEFVVRAATVEDPARRASALAKAHAIYDEAEAARRARLASQRREQSAKLKKRKIESIKRRRAVEEAPASSETRPPAPLTP